MNKKLKIFSIIIITNVLTALFVISISAKINVSRYIKNTKLLHESVIDTERARKKVIKAKLPTSLKNKKKKTMQALGTAYNELRSLKKSYERFIKRQKSKK